ncbi:cytochrome P450 2J5-like isoform X1 [Brachyhypopomus gauderio]|uniref:cytochrome P450 2J5-like isoform X1 n=2 Tax=Brachyhypopomus gauderio TaxID=698409 RepID=UPI004042254E
MLSLLVHVDWGTAGLLVLLVLLSVLLLEVFRLNSLRSRVPPGPTPLPFVGNMVPFMKNQMASTRLLTQYGELCTVHMGRKPMVVLNSVELMKEAFVHNGTVFSGRPCMPLTKSITNGYGIIMVTYSTAWKEQRRFVLHTLRNFGLGRKTVEERVVEEAEHLVRELQQHEGKPFYPIHPIMNAVANIICSIVFGDRFEYNNKCFAKLLTLLNEYLHLVGTPAAQIYNMLPIIKYFPGPHQKILSNASALLAFIREAVLEHKKTLDPDNLRDFIDAYLVEMSKHESADDSMFYEENLVMTTLDLFLAGSDTTATTLRWGLIFMMDNPDVQERCHEEIVRELGHNHPASMDDRTRLPYTHATVHEILRQANIVPLGVMHETTEDTQLQGYHITKGTMVMANLSAFFTDQNYWKHPDTFNPENFLDAEGQFCKQDCFVPFSLGPRTCLGESLARTELFIFFTSLIQRLRFSWPPGAPRPNPDGIMGMIRSPHPFNTVCHSRVPN